MLFYLLPLPINRVSAKNSKAPFQSACDLEQLFAGHSKQLSSKQQNRHLNVSSDIKGVQSRYFLERRFFI